MERKTTLKLLEKDVTRQVLDFLVYEGWTAHRLHTGTARLGKSNSHITLNPKGTPDWLFVRRSGARQSFYAELKAPGGKLSRIQNQRHAELKAVGHLVYVIDDFEEFLRAYNVEFR